MIQGTVYGVAAFQSGFLERDIGQGAVMEMGIDKPGSKEIPMLQHTGVNRRIINAGPNKRGGADPAHSEGASLERGAVEIRTFRQAIEFHPVKIGLPEKVGRKALLGRPVKKLLIHDF